MKKLTISDFTRIGEPGSFQHYFEHRLPDGGSICLEACMGGYCVAKYDAGDEIIGEKICTKTHGVMESQIVPGFSLASGDALMQAMKLANNIT